DGVKETGVSLAFTVRARDVGAVIAYGKMEVDDYIKAIPEDVLLMLADKDTAKEAWETLPTMHMGAERVKEAKVQTLRSDFEVIRMKDSESVDEFAMRLNTIVTGIRSLGDTIEEITVVKKFLRAVSIRFMQIVMSIEQFGDLKNMTVEEEQRKMDARGSQNNEGMENLHHQNLKQTVGENKILDRYVASVA
nr:hypothetical protein [Tanacetum cinerariifolium]